MPGVNEVFAAGGMERNPRMTLFIQNVSSAELA